MTTNQRYDDLVGFIINHGLYTDSRFGTTIELGDQQFSFMPGEILARKGQNLKVGWCELIQLIAGIYDGEIFKKYSPNSDQSLFTEAMNYGRRTVGSIDKILRELTRNSKTRQAYLFIGRPGEECSSNLPCSLGINFRVRDGILLTSVFMRSLDVIKGLPVDVMMFGGLSQMMANCLEILSGSITITASSAHVYTADIEADKVPLPYGKVRTFEIPKFSTHNDYLRWALEEAKWNWETVPNGIELHQI